MGLPGSEWLDFEHAEALAIGAAERIASHLGEAISRRGQASLVLAGGSTPETTYRHLALLPVDWQRVWIFWSDERCVDTGEAGSNFAMAQRTLLVPAGVPENRTFRIEGERGAAAAAVAYEQTLRSVLTDRPWPRFDVSVLGIGNDGHTASLFPDDLSSTPDSEKRWVRPARGPAPHPERVTLTLGALASSDRILFLVSGRSKAEIVTRLAAGGEVELPAARLECAAGRVTWMLDSSAWDRVGP
jgi:6-phosphogluconolactonase